MSHAMPPATLANPAQAGRPVMAHVCPTHHAPRHHGARGPRVPTRRRRGQVWPTRWRAPRTIKARPVFTPGQLSAVGSLEKRHKWRVLGGHGRYGAG